MDAICYLSRIIKKLLTMKCTLFILQTAIHVVCLRQKKMLMKHKNLIWGKWQLKCKFSCLTAYLAENLTKKKINEWETKSNRNAVSRIFLSIRSDSCFKLNTLCFYPLAMIGFFLLTLKPLSKKFFNPYNTHFPFLCYSVVVLKHQFFDRIFNTTSSIYLFWF